MNIYSYRNKPSIIFHWEKKKDDSYLQAAVDI